MASRRRLDAILFDFWGTLAYPRVSIEEYYAYRARCVTEALRAEGCNVSSDEVLEAFFKARRLADTIRRETFREVPVRGEAVLLLRELGLDFTNERLIDLVSSAYMRPFMDLVEPAPGAAETLTKLRDIGVKLGLVSNTMETPTLLAVMRKHGLLHFFDVIVTSDRVGFIKPSPFLFTYALGLLGAQAAHSVFVGDEDADIRGAAAIGMWTVAFEGFHPYRGPPPHFKFSHYKDFLHVLSTEFVLSKDRTKQ